MRKALIIAAMAVSVCLLGGCDFFRVLAGRPTSREIEAKRRTILALDTLAQQVPDEAVPDMQESQPAPAQTEPQTPPKTEPSAAGQKAPAVTPPKAPATTANTGAATIYTRSLDQFSDPRPEYRYYVMIGTFGSRENAVRQASRAEQAGYRAVLLPFRTGSTAVGVCPTNDLEAANATFDILRTESFFPKDAWILNIE